MLSSLNALLDLQVIDHERQKHLQARLAKAKKLAVAQAQAAAAASAAEAAPDGPRFSAVSGTAAARMRHCPKCSSPSLIRQEGCDTCTGCGYSKCA